MSNDDEAARLEAQRIELILDGTTIDTSAAREVTVPFGCTSPVYRRAREFAAKTGRKFNIGTAVPVPHRVIPEGAIVCPQGATVAHYRALKAEAKAKGVPFHIQGIDQP
jgi:hypothetical protein